MVSPREAGGQGAGTRGLWDIKGGSSVVKGKEISPPELVFTGPCRPLAEDPAKQAGGGTLCPH